MSWSSKLTLLAFLAPCLALSQSVGNRVSLSEAMSKIPGPGKERFYKAMEKESVAVFLYMPESTDDQKPHTRDELYVIVSGNGIFLNGTSRHPFAPGDVLHVPALVEHRFEKFSDDFKAWVIFYGPEKK